MKNTTQQTWKNKKHKKQHNKPRKIKNTKGTKTLGWKNEILRGCQKNGASEFGLL